MRRERGVTLIELLIAITLVSFLSIGMLMAMHVGLNAMEKVNSKLLYNRRVLSVSQILDQQVGGLMPVFGDCFSAANARPVRIPFFEGQPQTMRFVSSYSLEEANRGYPHILEFQVIPGDDNRGVRLIVNEVLYSGSLSAGASCVGFAQDPVLGRMLPQYRPVEIGTLSFVLADKLAYCNFEYREMLPPPAEPRWVPQWVLPVWPTGVHVNMAPLDPDPSKLQLTSFTIPIRITRDPTQTYVDQ